MTHRVTVLVAGGGPSGLSAAIELGRRGIDVLVVEPRAGLDPLRARAKTTSVRTMEHLRRWGLADRLRAAAPLPVGYAQDVVFCTGLLGHEITRFTEAFGLTVGRRDEYAEPGQQVPQPVVEQVLRAGVAELPSVEVRLGWRVTAVTDGEDTVRATLVDPEGAVHEVVADYLLGADGSSGVSRAAIGASYRGATGVAPNLSITFRAPELERRPLCAVGIHYWVIGARHGGIVGRLDLDGTWWAIVQGVDAAAGEVDPAALVRTLVGADVGVEVLATDPWSARMLLADRYRGRRVFLLGDAAHLNPPWGGHGFNTCVGDAVNLAWKLAAVLQGFAPSALLDSYEAERRPVAERTIDAAAQQDVFLAPSFAGDALDDDGPRGAAVRADAARRLAVKDGEFHSLGLVLGYDYRDSTVILADGGPAPEPTLATYVPSAHPGARLPHGWLPDGRSVYDLLGPEFSLLRLRADVDVGALVDAATRRGLPLAVVDLAGHPGFAALYAAGAVCVRPDGHVAWRGDAAPGALPDAEALLDRVTGAADAAVVGWAS